MKQIVERAGLNLDKKLTNHSACKHLVQNLNDFNLPANQIMQVSGHRNIHSIYNYSHINEDQHRQISEILHTDASSSSALYGQDMQPRVQSQLPYLHSSKTMKTASNSSVHVSGGFQIQGGTLNINKNQNSETMENIPTAMKRLRILESDTD